MLLFQQAVEFCILTIPVERLLTSAESHSLFKVDLREAGKVRIGRVFVYGNGRKDWVTVDHGCKS